MLQFRPEYTTCPTKSPSKSSKVPQCEWNVGHPEIRCLQWPGREKTTFCRAESDPSPASPLIYPVRTATQPDSINVRLITGSDSQTHVTSPSTFSVSACCCFVGAKSLRLGDKRDFGRFGVFGEMDVSSAECIVCIGERCSVDGSRI